MHMDYAYITGVGLLLIQVDSFLGWPKVIHVPDKKGSMIKLILRIIFSRNSIPKTLVSTNAPEYCDEDLNLWLEKIGCKLYKTLPYHPQPNGLAERIVQTVKMGLKACSQPKEKIVFLPRLLLSYYTIPHAGRLESPSVLMGRQIRALLTMMYSTNEKVWYKKNKESNPEFIMQKGHNTAIINREKGNSILAHADQIRPQSKYEEKNEEEISTIPFVNDLLEQPLQNEMSEDEIMHAQVGQNYFENSVEDQIMQKDDLDYSSVWDRSRSLRKRNTGGRWGEQSNPKNETITRSTRPTRGITPIHFKEV